MGRLAKGLASNQFLTALDLSRNDLGFTGTAPLADALRSNRYLRRLQLAGNGIDADAAGLLADALCNKCELSSVVTASDVTAWLRGVNGLPRAAREEYCKEVAANGVDAATMDELGQEDLEDLGVADAEHRELLFQVRGRTLQLHYNTP